MTEKKGYIPRYGEYTYGFYLNGEPVDELPQEALDKMAERLSRVVSQYFAKHPDVYEKFLAGRERKRQEELKKEEEQHEGEGRQS